MQLSDLLAIAAAVIAVVIAAFAYYQSARPLTLQGVTEIARDASTLAGDLQEVAQTAVAAAQQLKESGKIASNTDAYAHAVDHVQRWFGRVQPDVELDAQLIANAVESAYWWLKKAQGGQPTPNADLFDSWLREESGKPGGSV